MATATGRPQQAPDWSNDSALLPPEEWRLLHRYHPNVLLIGPAALTSAVIAALEPQMRSPVINWSSASSGSVPSLSSGGTIVVQNVAALDPGEQRHLIAALEDPGRVQVLATSPAPLMPLVESGAFDRRLYYLLNVVLVDLS